MHVLACTSTANLPACFQRFQTKQRVLWVNKTKGTGENAFNGDHLGTEGKIDSLLEFVNSKN